MRYFGLIWGIFLIAYSSVQSQNNMAYAVANIHEDLRRKAHVVVRKDRTEVILKSLNKYEAKYRRVVTILSKRGRDYVDFAQAYKEGSSEISDISIRIYDAEGKMIRAVKSKEIDDYAAYDGMSLISDKRLKTFEYEPTSYPITIAMEWSESSESTLSLPAWIPIPGTNISIEESSYSLINQTALEIRIGDFNLERWPSVSIEDKNYFMKNQPVVFRESYSPSAFLRYPFVYFSPQSYNYEGYTGKHDNWQEFGAWVHNSLLKEKANLNGSEVKMELDRVISKELSQVEIIKKLYEFVQENTRYILIGLDEGGLVPLSAQKVHEVKYGDCKALSFYMKTLLELYNIKANYVIVRAGPEMPEDIFEDFPGAAPANHVILNVPMKEDTIWLDCTSHDNPFNYLGSFTDDRLALQVDEDGGLLVRTPRYDEDLNRNKVSGKISFLDKGDISATVSIEDHGLKMDKGYYLKKLDQKEFNEYISTNQFDGFDKLNVTKSIVTINEEDLVTTQDYALSASKYGEIAGDYMIFNSAFLPMKIPRLKKDSNRENLIFFPRSEQFESHLEYHLPTGYRWNIPEDISLKEDYGYYHKRILKKEEGVYEIIRKFVLYKGSYDPSGYNDVKRFFDKIRKAEKAKFSITNKS